MSNFPSPPFSVNIRPTLRPKSTIGIVSPATWDGSETYDRLRGLQSFWEEEGFSVYIHPQNYLRDGLFAGTDAQRAKAFMDMVLRPDIGAISCVRGCTGSFHLLDLLDYRLIRENPKPIIGFSDVTVLLHAITKCSGLVTFYGPMGANFTNQKNDARTRRDLLTALAPSPEGYKIIYDSVECLQEGQAEGVLIGGHLNRMQLLVGTPFDCFPSNKEKGAETFDSVILFIETVDTTLLEIDCILRQFLFSKKFERISGLIIGEMIRIQDGQTSLARDDEMSYGQSLRSIIEKYIEKMPQGIPIVWNFPCGHGDYLSSMPIGTSVRLTTTKASGAELFFEMKTRDDA